MSGWVKQLCNALKLPRSTYYKALLGEHSKLELEAIEFQAQIKEIYFDSKLRYGAPKIQKVLFFTPI